jgi:hypothetical protein
MFNETRKGNFSANFILKIDHDTLSDSAIQLVALVKK